jgi:allantoin racemase
MRILCMLPAAKGVYPVEAEERRLVVMRSYATPSTQIDAEYMPEVSGFSPWGGGGGRQRYQQSEQNIRAAQFSADLALKAEERGYDAFCPFGTLDIGVQEARKRVRIPVVGQSEACFLYCKMLDRRFGACFYMPGGEERILAAARDAGAADLLVAHTTIGIPNSEYPERHEEVRDRFVACAAEARAKGAEMMGLVAMSICPVEFSARELSDVSGMPVLDAMAAQIAMAEWWHRTGLPPSLLKIPR